ncbi:MAG: flagellar protein FlgN [Oscillospiraceae bacterium]|nr:flagellar protein FlgN [Oscillospiraceae bacterium]
MKFMAANIYIDAQADESLRQMNDILKRKLSTMGDMYHISEQAYGYINEDDVERLNNMIEAKQELIREIDHLDGLFLIEFDKLKANLGLSTIDELRMSQSRQLSELRSNTADVMSMAGRIYDFDVKINHGVTKLRDDITAELTQLRRQKQISDLYTNDGTSSTRGSSGARGASGARRVGGAINANAAGGAISANAAGGVINENTAFDPGHDPFGDGAGTSIFDAKK